MNAILETTIWNTPGTFNHTYLMDGNFALGYVKAGSTIPTYFSKPLQMDLRNRTFKPVSVAIFNRKEDSTVTVTGSKGEKYLVNVDKNHCSCKGFMFRGKCKHLTELIAKSKGDVLSVQ